MVSSRSFGRPVETIEGMREALAMHVARAAERLRAARLVAGNLLAFVQTNTFIEGEPQYSRSASIALPVASAHTVTLVQAAHVVLDRIFRPGFRYKKTGVMLSGLEPADRRQLSLIEPPREEEAKGTRLMAALDAVNARWGRETLRVAATGLERPWRMRQAARSPRYTTCWEELATVGG